VALEEEHIKEIEAIDEDLMPGRSFTNGDLTTTKT
jgi:hypothetical protein